MCRLPGRRPPARRRGRRNARRSDPQRHSTAAGAPGCFSWSISAADGCQCRLSIASSFVAEASGLFGIARQQHFLRVVAQFDCHPTYFREPIAERFTLLGCAAAELNQTEPDRLGAILLLEFHLDTSQVVMQPWQPVLVQRAGPQPRGTELPLDGGERRLCGGALGGGDDRGAVGPACPDCRCTDVDLGLAVVGRQGALGAVGVAHTGGGGPLDRDRRPARAAPQGGARAGPPTARREVPSCRLLGRRYTSRGGRPRRGGAARLVVRQGGAVSPPATRRPRSASSSRLTQPEPSHAPGRHMRRRHGSSRASVR